MDEMTAKRFTIQGVGISDHERKRLYDLKTVDGFISIRDLLNELHEENEIWKGAFIDTIIEYSSYDNTQLDEENKELKKELDYIKNSIIEHIKHQKTELGQKALKEVIEDYNEWLLGHNGGFE